VAPSRLLLLLAALAASVGAAGALAAGVPRAYRFTGWMQPSFTPSHVLVEGDGGRLFFADRWNLTKTPVRYRVCIVREGARRGPCRTAKAPVDTRPSKLPVFVRCCGRYVARWSVGGHVVATWRFVYVPETS
jgi:hypothetical protein